jgi:tetratricopeptide (TPR) repeat protein
MSNLYWTTGVNEMQASKKNNPEDYSEQCLKSFQLCADAQKCIVRSEGIHSTLDHIKRLAEAYYNSKDYNEAEYYFKKSLTFFKKEDKSRVHSRIYAKLGETYYQQKNFLQAKESYLKSIAIDTSGMTPLDHQKLKCCTG